MAVRSHRRRSWALASTAVSLVLLAPACGTDDAESSPAPDAAAATSAPSVTAPAANDPTATATAAADTADTADGETETDAGTAEAGGPATDAPAPAPIELLSFSAPLVGGGTFDGAGYAAERPVAFWFWAPT
jgi:hypothetical protein